VTAASLGGPGTALENLATALDPREFAVILVTGTGRPPCLTVANRRTLVAEEIYAGDWAYWWPWLQPIAPTDDPLAAAYWVTFVLGAVRGAQP
jgi:hypothetical protein